MEGHTFSYQSSLGKETVHREYKEFSFHNNGVPYDKKEIESLLKTFNWEFNGLVEKALDTYIDLYLPRYACAFLDKNSDAQYGELYIGVNDEGKIHGIPYQGNLQEYMKTFFPKKEKTYNILYHSGTGNWQDYVKVDLIPVSYEPDGNISPTLPDLVKYYHKQQRVQAILRKHRKKYRKWQIKNDHYSQKLVELYQDSTSKHRFKNYLRKNCPYHKTLIDLIDNGFILEQKTHDEIVKYCEKDDNIYYWICKWKDDTLESIRKYKPKSLDIHMINSYSRYGPVSIFCQCNEIIPWWFKHNHNMNLYVIKISFRKPRVDLQIRYIDHLKRINRCYRTIMNLKNKKEPCCHPY